MSNTTTRTAESRQSVTAEELLALAGIEVMGRHDLVAPDDMHLIVHTVMELLHDHGEDLDQHGEQLRRRYESFACELRDSGLLSDADDQRARAERQQRLGELAEKRGNVPGAIVFYELAVRSWPAIGCKHKLASLRGHAGTAKGHAGTAVGRRRGD